MGEGQVAGRLEVIVESDTSGFGRKLREKLDAETAGIKADVGIDVESHGLRERLEAAIKEAATGLNANVGMDLNEDTLRNRLKGMLERGTSKLKSIKVDTETDSKLASQVTKDTLEAQAIADALKVKVPLTMGRSDLDREVIKEILQARILASAGINVPIHAEPPAGGLGGSGAGGAGRMLGALGGRGGMYVAIASLIQPAVGALMAGVGGLTAMAAGLAPALNTIVAAAPGIASMMQGMLGVKTALGGTGEALKSLAAKQKALGEGGQWTAAQQKQLAAELKNLSPSARKVITDVAGLSKAWGKLKKNVQEKLFQNLVGDIKPLAHTLLPTLQKGLGGTANVAGKVAHRFAEWMRTPAFNGQLGRVMASNNHSLGAMGSFLFNASRGMLAFLDAARPFTARLAGNLKDAGKWFNTKMQTGNKNGGIAAWLDKSADRAGLLWHMLKQIGGGLHGIFKAGEATGMSLLTSFDGFLTKWNKWVNSATGQDSIGNWFHEIEPAFRELGLIVRDIGRGLAHWAMDSNVVKMLHQIRTEAMPALGEMFRNLGHSIGPKIIDLITQLVRLLNNLEPATAVVSQMVGAITALADALNNLMEAAPGATKVLATLIGVLLAGRLLKKGGSVLGKLLGFGDKAAKDAKGLSAIEKFLANSGKAAPGMEKVAAGTSRWAKALELFRDGGKFAKYGKYAKATGWISGILTAFNIGENIKTAHESGRKLHEAVAQGFVDSAGSPRAVRSVSQAFKDMLSKGDFNSSAGDLMWDDGANAKDGYSKLGIDLPKLKAEMARFGTAGHYYQKLMADFNGKYEHGFGAAGGDLLGRLPGIDTKTEAAQRIKAQLQKIGAEIDQQIRELNDAKNHPALDLGKLLLGPAGLKTPKMPKLPKFKLPDPKKLLPKNWGKGGIMDQFIKPPKKGSNPFANNALTGLPKSIKAPAKAAVAAANQSAGQIKRAGGKVRKALNQMYAGAGKGKGGSAGKSLDRNFSHISASANKAAGKIKSSSAKVKRSLNSMGKGNFKLPKVLNNFGNSAQRSMNKVSSSSKRASGSVSRSFNRMKSSGNQTFNAVGRNATQGMRKVQQATQRGMTGAVNAVRRAKGPAGAASKGVANSIKQPVSGLRGEMNAAGNNAMAGLSAGIASGGNAAIAQARRVASEIAAITRSTLVIRSPSRVMMKLGGYVSEGLAVGIKKSTHHVRKAAKAMTDVLTKDTSAKDHAKANDKAQTAEQRRDEKYAREKERLGKRLSKATDKLNALKEKRNTLRQGVADSYKEYGSISSIADSMGGYANPGSVIASLRDRLKTGTDFKNQLAHLRKKGMGRKLYQQLLEMGVEAGAPIVEQLKGATPKQLKQIEKMQTRLAKMGTGLGKKAGDQLYGAGIKAADGLVNRLKKRRNEITKHIEAIAAAQKKKDDAKKSSSTRHGNTHKNLHHNQSKANHQTHARTRAGGKDAPLIGSVTQHIHGKNGEDSGREVVRAIRKARLGGVHA